MFFPEAYAEGGSWKFGLALPSTLAIVIVASTCRRSDVVCAAGTARHGGTSQHHAGLSLAGWRVFLAAVVLMLRSRRARGRKMTPITLAVIGTVAAAAFFLAYERAAKEGVLGPAAAVKYERQSQGDLGIPCRPAGNLCSEDGDTRLTDTRAWVVASDPKYRVGDGPSWSRRYLIYDRAVKTDVNFLRTRTSSAREVEAGIVGAAFWIAVLGLRQDARGHSRITKRVCPIRRVLCRAAHLGHLVSPFGADRRVTVNHLRSSYL